MQVISIKYIAALLIFSFVLQLGMAQNAKVKTQYAVIGNDSIAYRITGKGKPILLAQRLWGTLDTWDPLFLQQLSMHHRVITFDYPGVGYSSGILPTSFVAIAHCMKELSLHLKLNKPAVLGWSYGGFIAQVAALDYPDIFSSAILIGTNPPGSNRVPIQAGFLTISAKPLNTFEEEVILFFEPNSPESRIAAKLSHDRIYAKADISKIPKAHFLPLYTEGHMGFVEDKKNYRSKLSSTKVPLLIISGINDISMAAENWFDLLHKMPTAQITTLPQSGHGTHHQYPALVSTYIKAFTESN
jgi:pimeloyl-ACP methyl ester carboxylesterase